LVVEHGDGEADSLLFVASSWRDAEEIARSLRAVGQDVTVRPRSRRAE
jgi:hypothetical protein